MSKAEIYCPVKIEKMNFEQFIKYNGGLKCKVSFASENQQGHSEALALYRWKTPLTVSCVNGEKISNYSQPCQSIKFFVFEIFSRYKNHHVSST